MPLKVRTREGASLSQTLVPELAQCHLAVRPVFLHLDPKLQMHRALPQIVQLDARQSTDFLEALSALTDDDRLLTGALDPDDGVDQHAPVLLREAFDLHVDAVG